MGGCGCDSQKQQLEPFDSFRQRMLEGTKITAATERVSLHQALGRVLAQQVKATIDVPPADNSAMDGYALCCDGLSADQPIAVSGRIAAGDIAGELPPGTAVRIFTGSEIPVGADAVVMQEQVLREGDQIRLQKIPKPGTSIRLQGQDIRRGDILLSAGTRIRPQHLGVMASIGLAEVEVYRPLKVALLTTGDELVMPGQPCLPGQIYNSNLFTLRALLEQLGMEVVFPGIVEDSLEATVATMQQMAADADCIISSGGVSVGEEDHVRQAVEQLGTLKQWRLAIKPGKPFAQGEVCGKTFIGLPGNPSAALVTFLLLARPLLLKAQGACEPLPRSLPVRAGFSRDKSTPRQEFLRVEVRREGEVVSASPVLNQSSGALLSSTRADGLLVVPPGHQVQEGEMLEYYPLSDLLV